MSQLAEIHLRQARSFLNAGDPQRAVELLEKARALARDDRKLLRKILPELAGAYAATGQHDAAARCRDRIDVLGGPIGTQAAISAPGSFALPPRRRKNSLVVLLSSIFILALLGGAGYAYYLYQKPKAEVASTQPAVEVPMQSRSVPTAPVQSSSTPTSQRAIATATSQATIDPADYVPLLIVVGRYESNLNGQKSVVDWPLATGTAFVIHPSGVLLTNRHVTDFGKQDKVPVSLEKYNLPTFVLTGTRYVVCFGSKPSDHLDGELIFEGENKDVALLRIHKRFRSCLPIAARMPKQTDEIRVYGYPGVLVDLHNKMFLTDERLAAMANRASRGETIDLINEAFSPESFKVSVTRGIVGVAQTIVNDIPSLQHDAKTSEGNSGGPILNGRGEVVAITTWGGTGEAQGYNWGQLLDDELRQELFAHIGGN